MQLQISMFIPDCPCQKSFFSFLFFFFLIISFLLLYMQSEFKVNEKRQHNLFTTVKRKVFNFLISPPLDKSQTLKSE